MENPQWEAHLGRFFRTILPALDADSQEELLDVIASVFMQGARRYVTDGTLETQADRKEAMDKLGQELYQRTTLRDPNDGGPGQHEYTHHWVPRKEAGER